MSITQFLHEQFVIMILQLALGKVLKNNPSFENKFIGWATYALSLIGYTLAPASAHAAASLAPVTPYISTFALAGLQTILVTGVHSFSKNSLLPILQNGLRAVAYKILGGGK